MFDKDYLEAILFNKHIPDAVKHQSIINQALLSSNTNIKAYIDKMDFNKFPENRKLIRAVLKTNISQLSNKRLAFYNETLYDLRYKDELLALLKHEYNYSDSITTRKANFSRLMQEYSHLLEPYEIVYLASTKFDIKFARKIMKERKIEKARLSLFDFDVSIFNDLDNQPVLINDDIIRNTVHDLGTMLMFDSLGREIHPINTFRIIIFFHLKFSDKQKMLFLKEIENHPKKKDILQTLCLTSIKYGNNAFNYLHFIIAYFGTDILRNDITRRNWIKNLFATKASEVTLTSIQSGFLIAKGISFTLTPNEYTYNTAEHVRKYLSFYSSMKIEGFNLLPFNKAINSFITNFNFNIIKLEPTELEYNRNVKDIVTELFVNPEVLIDFPTLQKLKTLLLYKGYKHPVLN